MTEYPPNGQADGLPTATIAVIYTRVSTDAQERAGTSLETQERECLAHAGAAGWQVTKCIRDTAWESDRELAFDIAVFSSIVSEQRHRDRVIDRGFNRVLEQRQPGVITIDSLGTDLA